MENNFDKYFVAERKKMEEDKIEGNVFSFDDPEKNKSTRLKINKVIRVLGSGCYSWWVAEVNVELADQTGSEEVTHNMAIKRYGGEKARQDLKKSHNNYRTLKEAEIPTWDTYRINEEHKLALMTLGVKENEIMRTANDFDSKPDTEWFKRNPVEKIENLDEFVKKASLILKKLNAHGYRLRGDSYGIVFKPQPNASGVYDLDIIVADLDSLDKSDNPYYQNAYGKNIKKAWEKENKESLSAALFCAFPGNRDQKVAFVESIMNRIL